MCWVVFVRESTMTGTPSSMFRSILRQRSRKFVKLLTQPTKAAARPMTSLPVCSSVYRASFNCRSTSRAWTPSSISVMPSCLWKSRACPATMSADKSPPKKTSSIRRSGPRRSVLGALKPWACAMTLSTAAALARTCLPFFWPKASTVSTLLSASVRISSPFRMVTIGASYQDLGSNASMRCRTEARSASVSMPGMALKKLW
mmetsp:Transcript_69139/g.215950  ORF Transcript_69139/g.215950 Transcript_69139/m.215950 type:complete len:202 (-) Transcript_69139:107-712(-)